MHAYVYQQYLVYIIEIPLLLPTNFYLYKAIPFPMKDKTTEKFIFIAPQKEFIITDALRKQYGKMNYDELSVCLMTNEITYVCKNTILLSNYVPGEDCEASMLHPSSQKIPDSVCEIKLISLYHTYWIPLQLSNQWLYTSPSTERVTILCEDNTPHYVYAENRGRMTLRSRCKAYTSHVTLYASTKLTMVSNVSKDFIPEVNWGFDCCFDEHEKKKLDEIKLDIPLNNVMSSIDDLRIASIKVDDVKQMINKQEQVDYSKYYKHVVTGGISIGTMVSVCLCCYCCKGCRQGFFWCWRKINPKGAYDDCVNGCKKITNSFNNPHHNTIIAPNVHTLKIQDKDELTHALTQSLIELDKIGICKHETFRNCLPNQLVRKI
ncbi:uncharacterized protein LOC117282747 [Cryptotermes secundus]|uniref:uncharacterized protein LOC117282747 n=1 Tax=Cryptotermes secundus TaxID=105785 RepID=UPI001454BDDD|nr:uncharacterized protein LOC117282747 [Cryptotermes secundus]